MFNNKEIIYKIRNMKTGEYFQCYDQRKESYAFTEQGQHIKKLSTLKKHIRGMKEFGIDVGLFEIEEYELVFVATIEDKRYI